MKHTRAQSIIALFLVATMLTACATPNGSGAIAQGNPCQPHNAQSSFSPQTSFIQNALLNPLAKMGGSLLATAAANYSQKYTGKLDALLTKLVTPKKMRKKKSDQQTGNQGFPIDNQISQPGFGFSPPVDPNAGFPVQTQPGIPGQNDFGQSQGQIDPNTGLPILGNPVTGFPSQTDPNMGFPPQTDPNTGLPVQIDPNTGMPIDPNYPGGYAPAVYQEEVQPRGVPGQLPHATFSNNPCNQQQVAQNNSNAGQQNQPYGQDPNHPTQGYDPYAQQQGQNPYGQPPAHHDPYAQPGYPSDPYAQQGYPAAPTGQPGYPTDPYAQQGYPQDPYGQPPTHQDPYAQPGSPQNPNALAGYPMAEGTVGAPIGLDVVMVKKTMRNGAAVMVPIQDGDVLKDGRGDAKAGDKFRIMFRPHTDGYVYVIAIDGSGWAQGIFPPPTSPLANPVKAGKEYALPEGNNWFSLDQYKGIETIFFVASQEKRTDLEEILQSITGRERPATENPQQVTKVAMVPYGVGGARPSAQGFNLSSGSGQDQTIMPTSYLAKTAGQDLRLTRWFRHE